MEAMLRVLADAGKDVGRAQVLLVTGEAGIGKTRLLRELSARATRAGWRAIAGSCTEGSAEPHGALTEALAQGGLTALVETDLPPRVEMVLLAAPDGQTIASRPDTGIQVDSSTIGTAASAFGSLFPDLVGTIAGASPAAGVSSISFHGRLLLVDSRPAGHLVVLSSGQESEWLKDEVASVMDRLAEPLQAFQAGGDGEHRARESIGLVLDDFLRGVKPADQGGEASPEQQHWRFTASIARGLARIARERPLLLVLDDVQWADSATLAVLRALAAQEGTTRLAMVLAERTATGGSGGAGGGTSSVLPQAVAAATVTRVELARLPRAAARELLRAEILDLADGTLGELLVDRSGGIPLLLRSLVDLLRDDGALVAAGGGWRLTRAVGDIRVPSIVRDALLGRILVLAPEERRALEAGAVLGEVFVASRVACVVGARPLQAHQWLSEVHRRLRFIHPVDDGVRYRFDHPLAREAVYGSISDERRTELHRAAVGCLLASTPDSAEAGSPPDIRRLGELALHADRGGHPDAVEHLRRAADASRRAFRNTEAVRWYRAALDRTMGSARVETLELLGTTEAQAGRFWEAARWFAEAGEAAGDSHARTAFATQRARALERVGEIEEAVACLEAAPPGPGTPPPVRARWEIAHGYLGFRRNRFAEAEGEIRRGMTALEDVTSHGADLVDAWSSLGSIALVLGRLPSARESFQKALEISGRNRHLEQEGRALVNLALVAIADSSVGEALGFCRRAVLTFHRSGSRYGVAYAKTMLGMVLTMHGEPADAHRVLSEAVALQGELGSRERLVETLRLRATASFHLGRLGDAERDVREALLSSEPNPDVHSVVAIESSEILLAAGKAEEALALARGSLRWVRDHGVRWRIAPALTGLGLVLARTGERSEAERCFEEALSLPAAAGERWEQCRSRRRWGQALAGWGEQAKAAEVLKGARMDCELIGAIDEGRQCEATLQSLTAHAPSGP